VASIPELRLSALLRRLSEGGVDYVVVGGVAVAVQGYGRATKDLDITYATDAANLDALGKVLIAAKARPRGVPADVPFIPDGRTLRRTQILTLDTVDGGLDLLVDPSGAPSYAAMRSRADLIEFEDIFVRVAGFEDLLAMKRAAGRSQDLADVEALEVARRQSRREPEG
jgi:Nucleotidyl transferase AbiEii toxin, Type IV TA system